MKRFFGLLNFLLCLELIVGPIAPQYSFLIPSAKAQETSCPSGTSFDTILNRCITTEQTAEIMNAVASCAPQDKACYKANAESALKKGEEEKQIEEQIKNKGGLMGTPMKAAAVAVPLFMAMQGLFKSKKSNPNPCPTSPSVYIMLGAGAAVFIGDMFANSKHKKRLKKIKEEWEGIRQGEESGDKGSGENSSEVSTSSLAQTSTNPDVRKAEAKESQSEAFEMLAKSEDSLASAAKFKSGVYAIATLAFAGASVLSFLEAKKPWLDVCTPGEATTQAEAVSQFSAQEFINKNRLLIASADDLASYFTLQLMTETSFKQRSSPSIEDYERFKIFTEEFGHETASTLLLDLKEITKNFLTNFSLISSAYANDNPNSLPVGAGMRPTTPAGSAGQAVAGSTAAVQNTGTHAAASTNQQGPDPRKFLQKPIPRGIIAGIFAAWAGIMTMHARKQAKVSKARAKYLRDMKETFNDATGAISCTTQDRNNANNLRCYCYNSTGQRDPNKSNSQACTKLFTGKNLSGEMSYLAGTGLGTQKVCMTNNGIDEACSCRQNNTCLSAIPSNLQGFNPGTLSMLSSGLSPLNQVTTGQLAAGSIDGAAAVNRAGKILDAAGKLGSKIKGKDPQAAKKMANSLIASSQGGSAPSLSNPSNGASPFSMSPSQAAAQLEKELEKVNDTPAVNTARGGGDFAQPGGSGSNMEELEFGMTPQQLAVDQTTLAEMNKDLNYGQNDINSGSDANLFEVLSNRYKRSGMRRLFDEEGKTIADPANKSDITP